MVRNCKWCGTEFEITSRNQNPRKYCCKECAEKGLKKQKAYWNGKRTIKPTTIKYIPTTVNNIEVKVVFPDWVKRNK